MKTGDWVNERFERDRWDKKVKGRIGEKKRMRKRENRERRGESLWERNCVCVCVSQQKRETNILLVINKRQ